MSVILGLLGKVAGAIVPSLKKTKAKQEAVDTIISKRGETTAMEVYSVMAYKVLKMALVSYVVYNVVQGKVSLGEILKVLSLGI